LQITPAGDEITTEAPNPRVGSHTIDINPFPEKQSITPCLPQPTMRRASTLASFPVLSRSIATVRGGATATSASASHGLLQVALYSTTSSGSHLRRPWFESFSGRKLAIGVAGTLASVAFATSLTQEVYAKEPPPAELVPKEVVLYQYEACPFCNKVKGKMLSSSVFVAMNV
jgi:hypothetical protein